MIHQVTFAGNTGIVYKAALFADGVILILQRDYFLNSLIF